MWPVFGKTSPLTRRGAKRITLGGVYREYTLLLQQSGHTTGSDTEQEERWRSFMCQWRTANQGADVIVFGDTNLDHHKVVTTRVQSSRNGEYDQEPDGDVWFHPVSERNDEELEGEDKLPPRSVLDQLFKHNSQLQKCS